MKILISGAGIGGLTLAYWLHQNGHTSIVIEKAPDLRSTGYMIDFIGTGWDVANRMGIIPQLQQKSHHIPQIVYKDAQGRTTVQLSIEKLYRAANITGRALALNRADLVEILYETIRDQVEIRFGISVNAICQSLDGIGVTFTNGGQEEFDLVIGADGIHSGVRRLVMGEEREFARYLGYYVAAFYTSHVPQDVEKGYIMYVEPNIQFGVYEVSPQRWLTYIVYKHEDEGFIAPGKRLDTLRRHLKNAGWIVPHVLYNTPKDTPIYMDTVTQIHLPKWSSNRVALIGDAAYCLTLVSGQGASMAMAGAYFLAQELKRAPNYHQAFAAYEKRLRPYIERTQLKARNFAPTFIPNSRLRIQLTNWALRLVDLPPVSRLVGKQITSSSILDG